MTFFYSYLPKDATQSPEKKKFSFHQLSQNKELLNTVQSAAHNLFNVQKNLDDLTNKERTLGSLPQLIRKESRRLDSKESFSSDSKAPTDLKSLDIPIELPEELTPDTETKLAKVLADRLVETSDKSVRKKHSSPIKLAGDHSISMKVAEYSTTNSLPQERDRVPQKSRPIKLEKLFMSAVKSDVEKTMGELGFASLDKGTKSNNKMIRKL